MLLYRAPVCMYVLSAGCTIFIEVQGDDCISFCQNLVKEDARKSPGVYVSSSPQQAVADIEYFNKNLFERDFVM